MNFTVVKLKKTSEEYKKQGLDTTSFGVVLSENEGGVLVMFFNPVNRGDYLVFSLKRSQIEEVDIVLPKKLCAELENYVINNSSKIIQKNQFEKMPFNECDCVELVVEKERYSKFGLHKGYKGIIASNKAVQNKILVDFGIVTNNSDGIISVDFKDIKKVEQ